MNFEVVGTGHSFKGSMAYYLHDKRQEGMEAHPTTTDRVAWTETRNLATTGPHTATRIMIATAQRADELKAAAGIKNTGRKATAGPVFAFSLAWHPNEAGELDRAEMATAADHALKVLGLDHLQAVLVAHQDTPHPHVHVIVNRVDPLTGKTEPIRKPAVIALDKWADDYERSRGQIVSPNRAKKYEDREQKRKRYPDPAERKKYIEAKKEVQRQFKRAGSTDRPEPQAVKNPAVDPRAKKVAPDPRTNFQQSAAGWTAQVKTPAPTAPEKPARAKSEGSILKDLSDAQKVRHKQEWLALATGNKAGRDQVYTDFGQRIRDQAEQHKTKTKPAWAAFFKAARMEERAFLARERSIVGILRNALAATPLGIRGGLTAVFSNVLSASSRTAAFRASQEVGRGEFSQLVKARLDGEITALKQQRQTALAIQRQTYNAARASLMERQDSEKAKMREAWRQVYERRGKDPAYLARKKSAPQLEQKPMEKDFRKSGQLPSTTQAKPWPTTQQSLSTPAPAPTPAGDVPATRRTVQNVPTPERIDKTQHSQSTPPVRKDWGATNDTGAAPQPRKDWNATQDKAREIKPLPERSRDKDFER